MLSATNLYICLQNAKCLPRSFARDGRLRRKTTKSNYENRHSRSRRDGQPSGDDAERQRPRHHGHRPRRQGARRGGDAGRHHHRRGGLDHLRGAAQGLDTQVRSLHRGEPHRKRQHRRGGDRQAARCAQNHRPHRQQRVSRTQQQGDFHRNGNRLPFLSRKGRGGRGGRSAGGVHQPRHLPVHPRARERGRQRRSGAAGPHRPDADRRGRGALSGRVASRGGGAARKRPRAHAHPHPRGAFDHQRHLGDDGHRARQSVPCRAAAGLGHAGFGDDE